MIDVALLQRRLIAGGYDIGAADGVIGARTLTGLLARVAGRPMAPLTGIGTALAKHAPRFALLDNAARLANFVGQTCHESGSFRYLREIWGPTEQQLRYEGRQALGNTQPGDGKRFMGRGLIQLTGRANYTEMAMRSG
jgi:putative chitinase